MAIELGACRIVGVTIFFVESYDLIKWRMRPLNEAFLKTGILLVQRSAGQTVTTTWFIFSGNQG